MSKHGTELEPHYTATLAPSDPIDSTGHEPRKPLSSYTATIVTNDSSLPLGTAEPRGAKAKAALLVRAPTEENNYSGTLSKYLSEKAAWEQRSSDLNKINDSTLTPILGHLNQEDKDQILDYLLVIRISDVSQNDHQGWRALLNDFLEEIDWEGSKLDTKRSAKKTNIFELIAQVNNYKAVNLTPRCNKKAAFVGVTALVGTAFTAGFTVGCYFLLNYVNASQPFLIGMTAAAGVVLTLLAAVYIIGAAKAASSLGQPEKRFFIRDMRKLFDTLPGNNRHQAGGTLLDRVVKANSGNAVTTYLTNEQQEKPQF